MARLTRAAINRPGRRRLATAVYAGIACAVALLVCAADVAAQARHRKGRGSKRRAPPPAQQDEAPQPPPQGQDPYGGYGQQPPPQGQDPYGGYGQQPPPQGQDPYGGYGQQPPPQGQDPYGGYGQQPPPQGQDPYGYGYPQQPVPPPPDSAAEVDPGATERSAIDPTLVLGIGATGRNTELPSENGLRRLETGLVPAVELRLGARVYGASHHLQFNAAYQSSLGLDGTREPLDDTGVAVETPIRTHRLELGVAPAYRFDEGRDSISLGVLVAYGVRAFDSVVDLPVPRYTLHGPLARIELEVPLAEQLIVLRVAPELQLFVSASHRLRDVGAVAETALAIGGEASLQVRATSWAAVQLAYRESHASASTAIGGTSFTDVERYVLLSAVVHYFGGEP